MKVIVCMVGFALVLPYVLSSDVCDSQPCLNGGECQSSQWAGQYYRCACPDPYYGTNCGQGGLEWDPCSSNPCQNGGSCYSYTVRGRKGFICDCNHSNYGSRCQYGGNI